VQISGGLIRALTYSLPAADRKLSAH